MRMRCMLAAVAAGLLVSAIAWAGYPFVSDIPNVYLKMNTSSSVLRFRVSDDRTPADQLTLSCRSDTPSLVPPDDDHLQLGGSGSDRTLVVTPAEGQTGIATVTIIVIDTDGETNTDSLQVTVTR